MLKPLFLYCFSAIIHKVTNTHNYVRSAHSTGKAPHRQNNQMLGEMIGKSKAENRKILKKYGYK